MQFLASVELCCVGVCVKKGKNKESEETRILTKTVVVEEKAPAPKLEDRYNNKPWGQPSPSVKNASQYTDEDINSLKVEVESSHSHGTSRPSSFDTQTHVQMTKNPASDELASRYSGESYNDLNSRYSGAAYNDLNSDRGGNSSVNTRYSGSSYGGSTW